MPSCGPSARKNGTSAPRVAASCASSSGGSGRSRVAFASRSAVAASELPPPSPAATGISFCDACASAARRRRATASASSALRTSVSSGKPSTASSSAGSSSIVSARSSRCSTVATSCLPSGRGGTDDEREVELRGRRGRAHVRACASATKACGGSASARMPGSRPIVSNAAAARSRLGEACELERVGQRLAPVREGCLDDVLHARVVRRAARGGGRRRAPSRRSAAAGRPRARRDGSRCAR